MRHRLVLDVSEEAYAELLRRSGEKSETPEWIASRMLDRLLPDPLLRLAGAIKSTVPDISVRHDEYLGEAIHPRLGR